MTPAGPKSSPLGIYKVEQGQAETSSHVSGAASRQQSVELLLLISLEQPLFPSFWRFGLDCPGYVTKFPL